MSYPFKICDSVHGFIRFGEVEKQVIDSRPFQRLRYIHQMGVAYLVYPGATHTRFEHSLGVMELVTRIYNTLMEPHNQIFPSLDKSQEEIAYWRLILRLAALCHDMGHLPFSHTAEKSLLPDGGHEKMTVDIIRSSELKPIWQKIGPTAEKDIATLSVFDTSHAVTPWEKVLAKAITEDSFGADRIDYLIRDGHYTGVGYGRFDYHQLIDCLRILPDNETLSLGITVSGIQSVEALWIARYMMYARVYQHHKARVYTNHMHRFMRKAYPTPLSFTIEEYLNQTDYTLLSTIAQKAKAGDYDAKCLLKQEQPFCEISLKSPSPKLLKALEKEFGEDIFVDEMPKKAISSPFPVYTEDKKLLSCFEASSFLRDIPSGGKSLCLYAHPKKVDTIKKWLENFESVE